MSHYSIKKLYLFVSAIFCIPFLMYWAIYCIQDLVSPLRWLLHEATDLWYWFHDESLMIPLFYGFPILIVTAVIYLIAYRKKVPLWVDIVLTLSTTIIPQAESISLWFFENDFNFVSKISLVIIALVPITAIIGLIIAMVKYPKKAD